MLFNSYEYILLFLPITFCIYFLFNQKGWTAASKGFLIVASLFFYSSWKLSYLPLIVGSIIFNYLIGTALGKHDGRSKAKRKPLLVFGILVNIGLLGYFKYSDFFIRQVNSVLATNLPLLNLVLPLAISFFTFQQIAFLMDAYTGEVEDYNFLNYAMFVSFFPQLIAGPIVHHKEMMPQFAGRTTKTLNFTNIASGLFMLSTGLFKKVIIADTFALWASVGFDKAQAAALTFFDAWATSLSYTFQIYFDFSGYTDMAIGAALLLNIKLPFNFNSPYKATTVQSFWQRWHMTLGRFFKAYIYIPLGGNKLGNLRVCCNLMIVFLIGGLWHGAGWNFVFWGFLHGTAICIHRIWSKQGLKLPSWLAWFLTFNFVNLAWIFFRAPDWVTASNVLGGMGDIDTFFIPRSIVSIINLFLNQLSLDTFLLTAYNDTLFFDLKTYIWIAGFMVFVLSFRNSQEVILDSGQTISPVLTKTYAVCFSAIMMYSLLYMSLSTYTEFIYFNF